VRLLHFSCSTSLRCAPPLGVKVFVKVLAQKDPPFAEHQRRDFAICDQRADKAHRRADVTGGFRHTESSGLRILRGYFRRSDGRLLLFSSM
jgi:hypothetical protein